MLNDQPATVLEEISPHSQHSEAGDVSFESKGIEQDFDQICLKVSIHPLHFVVKNLLQQYFKRNGGGSSDHVGRMLQSKSSVAINVTLWKNKQRYNAILVIANGILMVVSKDNKNKLVEPFSFKQARSVIMAHNRSGLAAILLSDSAQVMHGFSHLIVESASLGLLLRFITSNYAEVRLDFSDSIALTENGSFEELFFH